MNQRLWWVSVVVAGLLFGCGGAKQARVSAGPMPNGGTFTGVWFSPQYGEMHLVQTGGHVLGEYEKDERVGRIQGKAEGNVMRFQWEENRQLVVGRPTVVRGKGYFRYEVGADGDHYVTGEWGHDDRETGGGPWNAVKSRTREPRLSTMNVSSTRTTPDSGGYDDSPSSPEPTSTPAPGSDRPAVDSALEGLDEY